MKNTNPAAESGAFIRRARGYSVVQNEALFNDRLSMSAKGSYALISARIDYTAVPLTKQWLMNHCTEGERAFNRAWDMLKNNGYLVAHVRPAQHGRFCYEYELRDSNNCWNGVYLIYYDAQGRVSSTNLTSAYANCYKLRTIGLLDVSGITVINGLNDTFKNCYALEDIGEVRGQISQNGLNLRWSAKLNKATFIRIANALSPDTNGLTVTFSQTAKEAAFTDAEWAELIGTKPNWTFSLA